MAHGQSQRDCITQPSVGPPEQRGLVLRWENVAGQLSTLKAVPSGPWHIGGIVQRLECRLGRATAAGADSQRSCRAGAGRSPSGPLAGAATPPSWPPLPSCGAKRPCRSSGLRRGCRSARPKGPSQCSHIWLRAPTQRRKRPGTLRPARIPIYSRPLSGISRMNRYL